MDTISLFEAWWRWSEGDPTLRDANLWGLRVLWWGRLGKLAAFVAGLVLIIDIIGPDRIITTLRRRSLERKGRVTGSQVVVLLGLIFVPATVAGNLGGYVVTESERNWRIAVFFGGTVVMLFLFWMIHRNAATWFARLYEHDRLIRIIRFLSLLAFAVGFHFDMLAS